MSAGPRVVLDTNIVVSVLLFSRGRLAWMRDAWRSARMTPLVCRHTAHELLRVLAYPKFRLNPIEQEALLSDFLPYAEVVQLPEPWPSLPACRDAADQVFLALAHMAGADALVTGDEDLLALQGALPLPILTAEVWAQRLST